MNDVQVALYARVSSEQQSEAKTVESQTGGCARKDCREGRDVGS